MRRSGLTLLVILLGIVNFGGASFSLSATAATTACLVAPVVDCSVGNDGNNVNVGGDVDQNDDPPPLPPDGNDGSSGENSGDGPNGEGGSDDDRCEGGEPGGPNAGNCRGVRHEDDDEDDQEPPTVVTSSQLLSFAPPAPSITSEPDGVAIVGMPMNVVVPAATTTSDGILLGFDVLVRFTPARIAIDYGDGTSAQAPPGSATWESLGQAEFTATETSHAYEERGTYAVSARVLYSAVVDFVGYGTVPVDGLVSSASAMTSVRAVTADTGLVDSTCAENPGGAGC